MHSTQPHPYTLMQNLPPTNPGQSRLMTSFRKLIFFSFYCNDLISYESFSLVLPRVEVNFISDMQMVLMHTGQDTLQVGQPSSTMSE